VLAKERLAVDTVRGEGNSRLGAGVVVFGSVAGGGWSYRSPAPRVMQVMQVMGWMRIRGPCRPCGPGSATRYVPGRYLAGGHCFRCLAACVCVFPAAAAGPGSASARALAWGWLLGARLAAGGWRLAVGASERVHCLCSALRGSSSRHASPERQDGYRGT
jgi:hypothetical protein